MPLVFAMVLTVALLGAIAIEAARAKLEEQQAAAIAHAVSTEILVAIKTTRAPDTTRPRLSTYRLDALARANGYDPERFHPVHAGDIEVGADWVRVTVRARHRGATARSATVHYVAAGPREADELSHAARTE